MRKFDDNWVISPQDLVGELECSHRLDLEWSVINNLIDLPVKKKSDQDELLTELGVAHEAKIAESLRAAGSFLDIGKPSFTPEALSVAYERTLKATTTGVETIYQATFYTGDFLGYADFLILVKDETGNPLKDEQGRFIYDPVDAKSARSAKRAAVLQVAAYAAIMREVGMATPQSVHLWLGGDKKWSAPALDVIDLAQYFMKRVREKISKITDAPQPLWAPPKESCTRCRWKKNCESGREEAQDLSLIQGIRGNTRSLLVANGIKTIDDMACATDEQRPKLPREVSKETFAKLRDQADIQKRGRDLKKLIFEVRDQTAFGLLPLSSPGDIWFDMEGDPFANDGSGLEYMFGYMWGTDPDYDFATFDARNTDEERIAFINFVDYLIARREEFPEMHVYHYASYEVSALFRLAQQHAIYEFEVDKLVREGLFVDLYSLVRRAFLFSTQSLSIKKIEPIYWDGNRDKDVSDAFGSVVEFEKGLALLAEGKESEFLKVLATIKDYNKDDVESTRQLDAWIRTQAELAGIDIGEMRPLAKVKYDDEPELEREEPVALQLLANVPLKREDRTEIEQGFALLSAAISFHHREDRPVWWNIFDLAIKERDELEGLNDVIVPSKVTTTPWGTSGKQKNQRRQVTIEAEGVDLRHILDYEHVPQALYEFAPEGFKIIQGSTRGFADAAIIEIEESYVVIEEIEKKGTSAWDQVPMALLPGAPIKTYTIEKIIREELGAATVSRRDSGGVAFPNAAWCDVLLRRPPRQNSGQLNKTDNSVTDITNALLDSDNSYIAVQGPPGTGKTYVGAHVISNLVALGWKIGVVAQSHSVVENLMDSVKKNSPDVAMAKKGQSAKNRPSYHVDDVAKWAAAHANSGFVIGGTTWTFSKTDVRALEFDLMVIDEAGQYSLANSLVVISAAKRALLLGDPQQLPQVSQGNHPEPVNESALSHLLGTNKTMPDHLGFFLDTTFRLHPKLAAPVSRLQYEDRLHSEARCERRNLEGTEPGLHIVEVDHIGNTVSSIEEADELLARIPTLIGKSWTPVKSDGQADTPRPLTEEDILVVTGYNAQVRYLKSELRKAGYKDIKVGTFDKFQGQEAPIVFVSMATSSSEDLPRGIEFLLSPNRLNVAISRAQWACFVLRSPQLSVMEPVSPEGMVMLGKFITLCK